MPEGSYPFPMYSGILEHRHYKKIGSAIWLFLWCISSTTSEKEKDGIVWGIVLGNKPIKISELEEEFGVSNRTIRSWIKTLEDNHYIRVTRAPYGLIFSVRNSKKFKNRSEENFHSNEGDRQHSSDLDDSDRQKSTDHAAENCRSNKDITEIHNAVTAITDPETILKLAHEVESYFVQKRGSGFNVSTADFDEIKKMVATGIPLEIVKRSIDKSFAEYKPKHNWDKIRNMAYCIPRCLDEWSKSQVDESITDGALPNRPVALGSSPQRGQGKVQEKLDNLRRIAEEEDKRAQG
ncbi:phage-like element PBSX protein XkdB [Paenibacillus antibioticophila]|uniref:Phage-like element PBSX protein XkdB n=1 Tax=Paenibacillus antibioticophila TaxID=1274374 RepID=A0A920CGZ9_9BACL|nr:HTH domain-containing protein [Paenibacillus antibioticophila]GIO36237.1 phage-like element PBSX protein XkdB [Paenibacillus antibioticophila]